MQLLHGWTVSKLRTCMYIYGVRLQGEYVVPCNEVELVALVPSIHIYTFYIGPTMANWTLGLVIQKLKCTTASLGQLNHGFIKLTPLAVTGGILVSFFSSAYWYA